MGTGEGSIAVGQTAPDFQLPGVDRGRFDMYDLHGPIGHGEAVLLVFAPTSFLAVPTDAFEAMATADWHAHTGLSVWGITGDSIFANRSYADTFDLEVTLLSDFHASVATQYGLSLEDWEAHGRAPTWAWVLIDPEWTVREVWHASPPPWSPPPTDGFVEAIAEPTGIELEALELTPP